MGIISQISNAYFNYETARTYSAHRLGLTRDTTSEQDFFLELIRHNERVRGTGHNAACALSELMGFIRERENLAEVMELYKKTIKSFTDHNKDILKFTNNFTELLEKGVGLTKLTEYCDVVSGHVSRPHNDYNSIWGLTYLARISATKEQMQTFADTLSICNCNDWGYLFVGKDISYCIQHEDLSGDKLRLKILELVEIHRFAEPTSTRFIYYREPDNLAPSVPSTAQ